MHDVLSDNNVNLNDRQINQTKNHRPTKKSQKWKDRNNSMTRISVDYALLSQECENVGLRADVVEISNVEKTENITRAWKKQ